METALERPLSSYVQNVKTIRREKDITWSRHMGALIDRIKRDVRILLWMTVTQLLMQIASLVLLYQRICSSRVREGRRVSRL